jgi:hypothetical protein
MEEAKYDYAKKGIRMPEINLDYVVDETAGSEYINHKYNLENSAESCIKLI